jgi:hypothetical protein
MSPGVCPKAKDAPCGWPRPARVNRDRIIASPAGTRHVADAPSHREARLPIWRVHRKGGMPAARRLPRAVVHTTDKLAMRAGWMKPAGLSCDEAQRESPSALPYGRSGIASPAPAQKRHAGGHLSAVSSLPRLIPGCIAMLDRSHKFFQFPLRAAMSYGTQTWLLRICGCSETKARRNEIRLKTVRRSAWIEWNGS